MAASFNGSTQNANLGVTRSTRNVAGLSTSFWLRLGAPTVNTVIFAYATGNVSTNARWTADLQNISGLTCDIRFSARSPDTDAAVTFATTTRPLTAGRWAHVVGTVDFTTNQGAIYINGALVASGAFSGNFTSPTTSDTDSLAGTIAASLSSTLFANMVIDDVRTYGRVIGPAEVTELFAARGSDNLTTNLNDKYITAGVAANGKIITAIPNLGLFPVTGTLTASPLYAAGVTNPRRRFGQPRFVSRVVNSPQIDIGYTVNSGINDNGNAGLILSQLTYLQQTATIKSLSMFCSVAAGQLRLGIYDASGANSLPGKKLAEIPEITPVAASFNTTPVTVEVKLPPGLYWLAHAPNNNAFTYSTTNGASGSAYFANFTYGVLPATFPAGGTFFVNEWTVFSTFQPLPLVG